MFDIAIVGSGPAGVSAAVNAELLNRSVIWFGDENLSAKGRKAGRIRNYPGFPDATGDSLMTAMRDHASGMGLSPNGRTVTGIYRSKDGFTLLCGDEGFEAGCAVLCLGAECASSVPGETELLGRGVSYCATCDGFLYRGKTIGIYVAESKYEDEARMLCGIAGKAYLFPGYEGCPISGDNVEVVAGKLTAVRGDGRLERIEYRGGAVEADGLFMLKSAVSPAALLKGIELSDGHIAVNRAMETNIPGVFAAGDCTGYPYQYAKAVGEGNVAVHSAARYLSARGGAGKAD